MTCNSCGAPLTPLFITWVCPNGCDKRASLAVNTEPISVLKLADLFASIENEGARVGAIYLHPDDRAALGSYAEDLMSQGQDGTVKMWGALLVASYAVSRSFCIVVRELPNDKTAGLLGAHGPLR